MLYSFQLYRHIYIYIYKYIYIYQFFLSLYGSLGNTGKMLMFSTLIYVINSNLIKINSVNFKIQKLFSNTIEFLLISDHEFFRIRTRK